MVIHEKKQLVKVTIRTSSWFKILSFNYDEQTSIFSKESLTSMKLVLMPDIFLFSHKHKQTNVDTHSGTSTVDVGCIPHSVSASG